MKHKGDMSLMLTSCSTRDQCLTLSLAGTNKLLSVLFLSCAKWTANKMYRKGYFVSINLYVYYLIFKVLIFRT